MSSLYNRRDQLDRRRELRRAATYGERVLWSALRERQVLGLRFRRQFGIGPYIVDFYCPEKQLVIESDGPDHDTPERRERDRRRTAWLESLGMTVLRFADELVCSNCDTVVEAIAAVASQLPSWSRGRKR